MCKGNRYEGDDWDWCDDCFCTQEKAEMMQKEMPIWQSILNPQEKKIKIKPRISKRTSSADGAASHAQQ